MMNSRYFSRLTRFGRPLWGVVLAVSALLPQPAYGCDPCAIYNVTQLHGHSENSWTFAVSEQLTEYDRRSGAEQIRDGELLKRYSTTQFSLFYDPTESFGLQLTLPLISRAFLDVEGYRRESETETGIGDGAILVNYAPVRKLTLDSSFFWLLSGGVKLPTGDTGSLERNLRDEDARARTVVPPRDPAQTAHHPGASAVGGQGRALSLGSGSVDYIFGSAIFARYKHSFLLTALQYTVRTEGDFDYRFDDDFLWSFGPAHFLLLEDHRSVALRASISGEHKGRDTFESVKVEGTRINNVFAGPELLVTYEGRLNAEAAFELPVYTESDDALVEPEWRFRLSIGYRF